MTGRPRKAPTAVRRGCPGDTSIKGDTLVIDNKAGNLSAAGNVTSTTILDTKDKKDTKKERKPSIATAKDLKYDDSERRLIYTGGRAHERP